MTVKQISVFLENKAGRLAEATKILGDNNINIRALSIADTADFGVLRMIVNNPDKAQEVLKNSGFTVSETAVIAMEVPDRPGGLAGVLQLLLKGNINIEYLYCFIEKSFIEKSGESAIVVLRVEDIQKAKDILTSGGVRLPEAKEVYTI